jgi:hypothetical protein
VSIVSTHLLVWALALTAGGAPQADALLAAGGLWAAPKRAGKTPPPRPADTADDDDDEKKEKPKAKEKEKARAKETDPERDREAADSARERKEKPAAKPRPAAHRTRTVAAKPTDALEAEVFGGDEPEETVRRRPSKARHEEEEEEDDEDAPVSLAVIAPRLLLFGVGGSVMGRSFSFDAPLQRESAVRGGYALTLESYPFLWTHHWLGRLGVGGTFDREMGNASIPQADGGTLSYAVTQGRWSADVRYAAALGEHVVLVPRLGYGHTSYDVQRRTESAPSTCGSTSAQVCLPDVAVSHLVLALGLRIAFNDTVAISLDAAFLPGTSVEKATGQLGSEALPSARGYSGELALTWQVAPWLAVRGALPLVRYSYAWTGPTVPYKAASETYYGAVIGATVATNR